MNGGYILVDCAGLDLSSSDAQSLPGIWEKAKRAISVQKPIIAENCTYGDAPVTPVTCFGWYIDTDEIVIVGATLHVHIKNDDTATVLDVVGA